MLNEYRSAFEQIKHHLTSYLCLRHLDFSKPFYIYGCIQHRFGGGGVENEYDDSFHPISFMSKSLQGTQVNYSRTKESLAIVECLRSFEYLSLWS